MAKNKEVGGMWNIWFFLLNVCQEKVAKKKGCFVELWLLANNV